MTFTLVKYFVTFFVIILHYEVYLFKDFLNIKIYQNKVTISKKQSNIKYQST